MRTLGLLIMREVHDLWHRKAYWITTALLIALVSAAFLISPWLSHHQSTVNWSATAPTPAETAVVRHDFQMAAAGSFVIHWVKPAEAAIVVSVPPAPIFAHQILVQVRHDPAPTAQWIIQALDPGILGQRLSHLPNVVQVQQALAAPVVRFHRGPQVAPTPAGAQLAITSSLVMVVFLTLSIYGQMTMASVATEKASRLSELLSVRLAPATILVGKWAGVGMAAALQIALAVLTGLGFLAFDPAAHTLVQAWHLHAAPIWLWVTTGVGFVFGYGFYGLLFLSLGSSLTRPEDARAAMGLPTFGLLAAYGAVIYAMAHTTSLITHILTMLPPFFPFLIIFGQGLGTATALEWIVGTTATGISVVILLWWSARQYQRTLYHRVSRRTWGLRSLTLRR